MQKQAVHPYTGSGLFPLQFSLNTLSPFAPGCRTGTDTHGNLFCDFEVLLPMAKSLENADLRGDAQADSMQSHHPLPTATAFSQRHWEFFLNWALSFTQVVYSLNSFVAISRHMTRKQSCPDRVALLAKEERLEAFQDLLACVWGQPRNLTTFPQKHPKCNLALGNGMPSFPHAARTVWL